MGCNYVFLFLAQQFPNCINHSSFPVIYYHKKLFGYDSWWHQDTETDSTLLDSLQKLPAVRNLYIFLGVIPIWTHCRTNTRIAYDLRCHGVHVASLWSSVYNFHTIRIYWSNLSCLWPGKMLISGFEMTHTTTGQPIVWLTAATHS